MGFIFTKINPIVQIEGGTEYMCHPLYEELPGNKVLKCTLKESRYKVNVKKIVSDNHALVARNERIRQF